MSIKLSRLALSCSESSVGWLSTRCTTYTVEDQPRQHRPPQLVEKKQSTSLRKRKLYDLSVLLRASKTSPYKEIVDRALAETLISSRRQHRRIAFGWLSQPAVDTYTPLFDFEGEAAPKRARRRFYFFLTAMLLLFCIELILFWLRGWGPPKARKKGK